MIFGLKCYPHSFGMTVAKISLAPVLLLLSFLAACGSPGEPLPPSLELARPVSDLRATRKGNTVTLTWSAPTSTTDRHNIRHPGPTVICRSAQTIEQCGQPVAKLPPTRNHDSDVSRTYIDTLASFSPNVDAKFVYAIEVLNSYGKTSGPSNQVEVPAAPALPAPADLKAQASGDGIHLSWTPASDIPELPGIRFLYRLYRQEDTHPPVVAGEVPAAADAASSFIDSSFEWGKTYGYWIAIVTLISPSQGAAQQVEGEDSLPITLVARDVFPPATPSGLQAVFSGPGQKPFIDLVWAPDTETDLAGYNLYRSEGEGDVQKLNSLPLKSPAFRDDNVVPGHEYHYFVSAVDIRGNESPRSEQAEEKLTDQ